ncbi:hypothetical protein TNCV_3833471 [Trichonephila clavipes]|nr:hypothetical protein TNCV_3833471 [Trichonephila clavipes]
MNTVLAVTEWSWLQIRGGFYASLFSVESWVRTLRPLKTRRVQGMVSIKYVEAQNSQGGLVGSVKVKSEKLSDIQEFNYSYQCVQTKMDIIPHEIKKSHLGSERVAATQDIEALTHRIGGRAPEESQVTHIMRVKSVPTVAPHFDSPRRQKGSI